MSKLLFENNNWDLNTLSDINKACEEIAVEELGLSYYPNVLEVISADQMLEAYTSVGMPVMYKHWSFGKRAVQETKAYEKGMMGLAYEIVINSDPCISYLMETNTATMQALVIAHAAYGHNSFFKNNYLFKQWTDASAIIDYLVFARNYVAECENKYGIEAVERTLDAAHSIQMYGVDKYKRPSKLSAEKERARQKAQAEARAQSVDGFWDKIVTKAEETIEDEDIPGNVVDSPEENLLYFIEKNSPILSTWQRELVRIVRKIAQYFYPQRQTQVMNEGWASTVHYFIMSRLQEKGMLSEGNFLEFLASHTAVVNYRKMDPNINPYWLGFNIYADIKRICQNPTKEDEAWFPELCGQDWLKQWHYAVENFRDESFIRQYMSPKLLRDGKYMLLDDHGERPYMLVQDIHNERGYRNLRNGLADRRSIAATMPDIQITGYSPNGDRTLYLTHHVFNDTLLEYSSAKKTLDHIHYLWGFDVFLSATNPEGRVLCTYLSEGDDQ